MKSQQKQVCSDKRLVFSLLILIFSTSLLRAQLYDFVSFGVEQGLGQSEVNCMHQDVRGFLWVGTSGGGMSRFDGQHFQNYDTHDGMGGQMITAIQEDARGNLIIGNRNVGVDQFDGKTFVKYDQQQGLLDSWIYSLAISGDEVYAGSNMGLSLINLKSKLVTTLYKMDKVTGLICDRDGTIWGISALGFFRVEHKKVVFIPLPKPLKKGEYRIAELSGGIIALGVDDGLYLYNKSTGVFFENAMSKQFDGKRIDAIYQDRQKNIWIASSDGVFEFFTSGGQRSFSEANGFEAKHVFQILQDNTGHFWFATKEKSLVYLRSEIFNYYDNVPGLNVGSVMRIVEDHSGLLWFGSYEKGLWVFDGSLSKEVKNGAKSFDEPVGLLLNRAGDLWVGDKTGVTLLQNQRPVKHLLDGIHVRTFYEDRAGNLWIGTWGHGVYKYDGKTFLNITTAQPGFPHNYVHAIFEDRVGNMWFGTGLGLVKYDGIAFKTFDKELCNPYIGAIAEDASGKMWFYTDQCVVRYDGTRFEKFNESTGLSTNTIYQFHIDRYGNVWVGTNKGLDCMRFSNDGKLLGVKHYSAQEGFRGIECNSRSVCETKDGSIWFGTVRGVIRYNPAYDKPDPVEPALMITGILLFLEKTDWSWSGVESNSWFHLPTKIGLPYNQNHLTFQYLGVHLNSPTRTRYQFMLVGFDSIWQPIVSTTEITYANLPPGQYLFKVRAANGDGDWSKVPTQSCPITIFAPPPPFWKTWWFYLLVLIVIGSALFYAIVIRARIARSQRIALEQEVQERTREISKQNEEKTLMLKEIHHRVKNNLQVISSLLNLQADGITDARVLTLFEDCRHRVNSMALIHQKMYQSKNLVDIDIRSYIDDLLHSLVDAYETNTTIKLITEIEEHQFSIDTIVPLGLILNETISNSLKYAFEGRDEGELRIALRKTIGSNFILEISDNGKGLPENINLHKAHTLGLQLITMLSEQINGKVDVRNYHGVFYSITFEEVVKERF